MIKFTAWFIFYFGLWFSVSWLGQETLQSQSLLSDPDWLKRHDPHPLEEVETTQQDNLSSYELQVIEELMGEKPSTSSLHSVLPEIQVPRLSPIESQTPQTLKPMLLPDQPGESEPEVVLNFPWWEGFVSPDAMESQDGYATFDEPASIESVQRYLQTNPQRAQVEFEQIEHELLLEDRARLKIKLLFHLGQLESAETMCRAFIRELSYSPWVSEVYFYLLQSLNGQQKNLDRDKTIERHSLAALAPPLKNKLLRLLSDDSLARGNLLEALHYLLEEQKYPHTSGSADPDRVLELLNQVDRVEDLRQLALSFSGLPLVQKHFPKRELNLLVSEQRFREASGLLDRMLENAQRRNELEQIKELKNLGRRFSVTLNVNPYRIGVILPLSSNNPRVSKLVQQTLEGLRLALLPSPFPVENQSTSSRKPVKSHELELILRDSKLNSKTTRVVFSELVEQEHVIAVVGPLARRTSEAAAEEAQRWQVPMISLSQTSSIPEKGDFVFRNNQNWKLEVESLVRFAIDYHQAHRFVILFTQNREGREKARLFQQAVMDSGARMVAIEGFTSQQQSFIHEFDAFSGKLRLMSIEESKVLVELKEKEDPILNFDAVFVALGADRMKDLQVIFPYAAVYQMQKTLFLGDSGWNHAALPFVPRYQAFRSLVFTDGYVLQPEGMINKHFFELHERVMFRHQNYSRPSSYTAYAFDTLSLLKSLLGEEVHHSHRDLQRALLDVEDFPGVTGSLSFNGQGEIQRNMKLLTLRKGSITPLE